MDFRITTIFSSILSDPKLAVKKKKKSFTRFVASRLSTLRQNFLARTRNLFSPSLLTTRQKHERKHVPPNFLRPGTKQKIIPLRELPCTFLISSNNFLEHVSRMYEKLWYKLRSDDSSRAELNRKYRMTIFWDFVFEIKS